MLEIEQTLPKFEDPYKVALANIAYLLQSRRGICCSISLPIDDGSEAKMAFGTWSCVDSFSKTCVFILWWFLMADKSNFFSQDRLAPTHAYTWWPYTGTTKLNCMPKLPPSEYFSGSILTLVRTRYHFILDLPSIPPTSIVFLWSMSKGTDTLSASCLFPKDAISPQSS